MDHGNNCPKHEDNKHNKADWQCENLRKSINN